MEHRRYRRRPLQLEVELMWRGALIGKTRSLDANREGIRLEARDIDLHPGQMVRMNIPPQKQSAIKPCHTRALVIHTSPGCIGLMLDDDPCIRGLLE